MIRGPLLAVLVIVVLVLAIGGAWLFHPLFLLVLLFLLLAFVP